MKYAVTVRKMVEQETVVKVDAGSVDEARDQIQKSIDYGDFENEMELTWEQTRQGFVGVTDINSEE